MLDSIDNTVCKKGLEPESVRKTYATPVLAVHGSLDQITGNSVTDEAGDALSGSPGL